MHTQPFVLKSSDAPSILHVLGVRIAVLVPEAASDTQRITLQSGDEGAGPPPHSHGWDESFYVIRGEVRFRYGEQTATCLSGSLIHIPAGTVHAFSFGPGGGEMLEITGAGSQAIAMFTALDRDLPPGPPDVAKISEIAGAHGLRFHLD